LNLDRNKSLYSEADFVDKEDYDHKILN